MIHAKFQPNISSHSGETVVLISFAILSLWRPSWILDQIEFSYSEALSYKDHVTNEEARRKIQAAIGEYDELLTLVKKRKLRWFGHVSRSSGLAKTILQGTVKGKRKRGRQKKRWEDNIKEWTGMDFASSTRAPENRSRWKEIVANSSVVPRRPSKVMG